MLTNPFTFKKLPKGAWPSPAKLNLFLHILGRREDGYHQIQTLFQLIDACDALYFDVETKGLKLKTDAPIPGKDNLIIKAAKLLQAHASTELNATIKLHKRLPIGGGVGGGSSNAATTLVALNHLWSLDLSNQELSNIGLSLGADVPLFVQGYSAFAEGIGEALTPFSLPKSYYLVLTPHCHISTKAIFSHKDLTRATEIFKIRRYEIGMGRNDCQLLVHKLYPAVAEALDWLSQYAEARLTGTGSSIFARFSSFSEANEVFVRKPTGLKGFIAEGVDASPLGQYK